MLSQLILAIKQSLTPEDEILRVSTRDFPAYVEWVVEKLPGRAMDHIGLRLSHGRHRFVHGRLGTPMSLGRSVRQ
jgi:hypothetical protein